MYAIGVNERRLSNKQNLLFEYISAIINVLGSDKYCVFPPVERQRCTCGQSECVFFLAFQGRLTAFGELQYILLYSFN